MRPSVHQGLLRWGSELTPRRIGQIIGSDIGGQYGLGIGTIDSLIQVEIIPAFIVTEVRLPSQEWSHLAVAFSTDRTRTFLNGKKIDEGEATRAVGGTPFVIGTHGKNNQGGWYFGEIQSVRISGDARYQDDFSPPNLFVKDAQSILIYDASVTKGDRALI